MFTRGLWLYGILGLVVFLMQQTKAFKRKQPAAKDYSRLIATLMSGYDKKVLPLKNASEPVLGKIGLSLIDFRMNDKEQSITINAWLDMEWVDYRISWDAAQLGVSTLRLNHKDVWQPDFVVYQSYDPQSMSPAFEDSLVTIQSDGLVFFAKHLTLKALCPMDLRRFPYDTQTCKFKFGSWVYDGFKLNITKRSEGVDLSNFYLNSGWDLTNTSVIRHEIYYACCPESFPDVTFNFTMARRPGHLSMMYVSPALILALMVPIVFLLPYGSGEKTLLAVAVQVCVILIVYSLNDYISSEMTMTPILVKFYGFIFVSAAAALVLTTVVNAIIGGCTRGPPDTINRIFSCCSLCLCAGGEPAVSKSETVVMDEMAEGYNNKSKTATKRSSSPRAKWMVIATVIDRICFILFAVLISCGIASYLVEMAAL